MVFLTNPEKNFFANHWHETMALRAGSAITWLNGNGIRPNELYFFILQHQKEYHLAKGPPKPETCEIPWTSAEEFRARSEELKLATG